jgi:hypothetical protein
MCARSYTVFLRPNLSRALSSNFAQLAQYKSRRRGRKLSGHLGLQQRRKAGVGQEISVGTQVGESTVDQP